MVVVGERLNVKDHLIKAFCRPGIGLPVVNARFGVVIEWAHAHRWRKEMCAFFEDRRPEVAVIDDLVILRVIGMVGQNIMQAELVGSGNVAQFGHGLQIRFFERALFDQTPNADLMRGGIRHLNFHL